MTVECLGGPIDGRMVECESGTFTISRHEYRLVSPDMPGAEPHYLVSQDITNAAANMIIKDRAEQAAG